jgi:hypothetical protein
MDDGSERPSPGTALNRQHLLGPASSIGGPLPIVGQRRPRQRESGTMCV